MVEGVYGKIPKSLKFVSFETKKKKRRNMLQEKIFEKIIAEMLKFDGKHKPVEKAQ